MRKRHLAPIVALALSALTTLPAAAARRAVAQFGGN